MQPQPTTTPTQTRHPWRAVVRTVVAGGISLLSVLPYVLGAIHVDGTVLGAQALAVMGGITRVLALPQVDAWLREYVPWLSAEPRQF